MVEKLETAVLLVGGEGTRLRPYTDNLPKPLVSVGDKPILEWSLGWLKSYGINNIVLGCGPKKDKIQEFMESKKNLGFKSVQYSENSAAGGTGEAFKKAIDRYVSDENYIAMNGDELTNLDLAEMIKVHHKTNALVTMALVPFKCPYSLVELDQLNGKITGFSYGKTIRDIPISIGIYIFNKKVNNLIPEIGPIEQKVFTPLASENKIAPYMLFTGEEWATVNDHKQRLEAEKALKRWGLIKD